MNVSVFALGRTGLPLSLICAESGFDVIGIDINEELVQQIKNGKTPFYEPGMKELFPNLATPVILPRFASHISGMPTASPRSIFFRAIPGTANTMAKRKSMLFHPVQSAMM